MSLSALREEGDEKAFDLAFSSYNHTLYSLSKPPPAESINVLQPLVDLGPEGEYALAEPLRRRMSEHDVL